MEKTADFLRNYIANVVDYSLTLVSFSTGTSGTTVFVKNLLHAKEGLTVTIDSVDYSILSVDVVNQFLTVEAVLSSIESIALQAPYYFNGTAKQVNLERANNVPEDELYPFVWLHEILQEDTIRDELNPVGRISPIRLFFLDCYDDSDDYDTRDHYQEIISRMDALARRVEQSFYENEDLIGKYDKFTIINLVKFGVFSTFKGHERAIFDEKLSGVELRMNLPVLKQCSVTC